MLKRFGNKLINTNRISEIEQISPLSNGTPRLRFVLDNGETFVDVGWTIERFEEAGAPVIAASIGFSVIEAFCPDSDSVEWSYVVSPIIAFSVPWDGLSLIPILIEGTKRDDGYWAVRHPDGRCERPELFDFPTEAEWKAWIISEWAADQARKAKP